ncbi:DUF4174 domain-containing protein [Rhizobium binxianense]
MSKTLLYGATKVDETSGAYSAAASLAQFQWRNRVLVIFADKDNSRAARQENLLLSDRSALEARDMVVLKIAGDGVKPLFGGGIELEGERIRTDLDDPDAGEFAAVLVGKDGTAKLRASEPVSDGELFAIIDSMPVRAGSPVKQDT